MRTDPNLYSSIDTSLQTSQLALQSAMNQLSSGLRVAKPSDDAAAFAADTRSVAASTTVDRYTRNTEAISNQLQTADASLSSVVSALTQAISLGTEGGNSSVSSAQRQTLAEQVQSLLTTVVAQANQTSDGAAVFAGTAGVTTPFIPDPAHSGSYLYVGNSEENQAQVGDALTVATTVSGSAVFQSPDGSVLGSLQQMATALSTGGTDEIAAANAALTAAVNHVGEVRAQLGASVNQLSSQSNFLSQETLSLTSQQTSLVDVDTATAAVALTQAQTANSAVLAMAAKILPESLLNYLH